MGKLIFILGGARSGKSRFAEQRARQLGGDDVLYVATAEVGDDEMRRRVEKHREQRPAAWRTLEASRDIAAGVQEQAGDARVVLLDCLSLMVAAPLMAAGEDPENGADEGALEATVEPVAQAEVEALLDCAGTVEATFIVVSNEVGMGVVPPSRLGRLYRDVLGRANQRVAAHAAEVYLLVAGIPMRVK